MPFMGQKDREEQSTLENRHNKVNAQLLLGKVEFAWA